jgi:hypothetical protein
MNYYTKDGKIATILSKDYGTGWWTSHQDLEWLTHPELAQAIDDGYFEDAQDILDDNFGHYHFSARDLCIEWADRHRKFQIQEYDGYETLIYKDEIKWLQF